MPNLQAAIQSMELNKTPYWWLYGSQKKVGQYVSSSDMADSIEHLEKTVALLPPGKYELKSSDNEKDHRGAVHSSFTTAITDTPINNNMVSTSTNAYNIPDNVYKQIQEETERTLLFKQMSEKFGPLVDLVKELDTRVKKLENDLADDDDDGTPNFLDMAKKGLETVKAGTDIKNALSGTRLSL